MSLAIDTGFVESNPFSWYNVITNFKKQGALGDFNITPASKTVSGCSAFYNGIPVLLRWAGTTSFALALHSHERSTFLEEVFSSIIGENPLCTYECGEFTTTEWDLENPEQRLQELRETGSVRSLLDLR